MLSSQGIHKKDVRKGNVLVSHKAQQLLCSRVIADVQVLKTHSTTIRVGYQPILHVRPPGFNGRAGAACCLPLTVAPSSRGAGLLPAR